MNNGLLFVICCILLYFENANRICSITRLILDVFCPVVALIVGDNFLASTAIEATEALKWLIACELPSCDKQNGYESIEIGFSNQLISMFDLPYFCLFITICLG